MSGSSTINTGAAGRTEGLAARALGRVWALLATNRWPDRHRVSVIAIYMLIAYVPMMAHVFAEATGRVGSDFLAFWGAGRQEIAGHAAQVYSLAAEQAAQAPSHTGQMVAYVNPPPYLFFTAPLGLLGYGQAWLVWALGGWALWFAVCRHVLPRQPLTVLAFPGAYLAACHAQNGFVTGALLVGGVLLVARGTRRSEWLAGVLFGALVIKPHLALMVPLWLIAGGRWRAVAGAALSAGGLMLASLIVFGPETWAAWPQSFDVTATLMAQHSGPFFYRMATPYALLRVLLDADIAFAGQAVITLALGVQLWLVTRRRGAGAGTGAAMLAATAIGSPYLFSYDLAFLVQPVLWLVASAQGRGWRRREKVILIGLWLSPLATRAAALPMHANLMPLAGAVLFWMVLARLWQATPAVAAEAGWHHAETGTAS